MGLPTPQYNQAIYYANKIMQDYGLNTDDITFVGHSLGGGLASAAAHSVCGNATTFNAAGLNWLYKTCKTAKIDAYITEGDILNKVQSIIGLTADGDISYTSGTPTIPYVSLQPYDSLKFVDIMKTTANNAVV